MNTCFTLPDGYAQTDYVNLNADPRLRRKLNTVSFLIGAAVIAVGWLVERFDALLALLRGGMRDYFLWVLLLAVCILAYFALHELTHGLLMRLCAGIRPRFGRKGLLLYVGSEAYFCRRDCLMIVLAPAVLFALAFALPSVFLRGAWFWLFVGLQLANLGGAVGDYYLFGKALRQKHSALFRINGAAMAVYTEKS